MVGAISTKILFTLGDFFLIVSGNSLKKTGCFCYDFLLETGKILVMKWFYAMCYLETFY